MSNLSDERIAELVERGSNGRDRDENDVRAALLELQHLRSAAPANRERVRSVVAVAALAVLAENATEPHIDIVAQRVATRVADQLATARPVLSAGEREQLEHHIRDHRVTCSYSCSIIERLMNGTVVLSEEDRASIAWLLSRATDEAILGKAGGHGMQDAENLSNARASLHRLLGAP